MRTCVFRCCLTLLGLSLVLCGKGVSSQPDLDLRHRRLLQRVYDLGLSVQDILSQLTLPESEFQESDISTMGTKQDLTVELERPAEDPNILPPRERKAGCKNFYWKGFTSC
ncbi:somatostatin 1.2 isoform X2 [Tachysurus vachellii]|uniref:somatostatin 1.2 isoform X2 n=1 Tax=Tachysurus vachellii TaxID=175792 RepID=UPI00296ADC32|nr:somatostatin 1.2 isoform X2 [Tachysurus vachellii]